MVGGGSDQRVDNFIWGVQTRRDVAIARSANPVRRVRALAARPHAGAGLREPARLLARPACGPPAGARPSNSRASPGPLHYRRRSEGLEAAARYLGRGQTPQPARGGDALYDTAGGLQDASLSLHGADRPAR